MRPLLTLLFAALAIASFTPLGPRQSVDPVWMRELNISCSVGTSQEIIMNPEGSLTTIPFADVTVVAPDGGSPDGSCEVEVLFIYPPGCTRGILETHIYSYLAGRDTVTATMSVSISLTNGRTKARELKMVDTFVNYDNSNTNETSVQSTIYPIDASAAVNEDAPRDIRYTLDLSTHIENSDNVYDGAFSIDMVTINFVPERATDPDWAGCLDGTSPIPSVRFPGKAAVLSTKLHARNDAVRMGQQGLHTIYTSADPPEIDIVAVHGLNFKNSPDHARRTWTRGEKLWLRDFLPERLPRPGRVMLFEYNSSPAMGAAAIKLDDHAKNLLQWLALERKAAPERPLVFIAHSLGGLVVKEALVEASINSSYKSIIDATRLLVFFATPHQGGNYASVGEVMARIVRAGLRNDLIPALQRDSHEASRRFEQSRHLYERCLVVSFFEGESYKNLGIIVDRNSASLNLPGSREKQVAVHADHSSICKFDSPDSAICKLVIGTIVSEMERAIELERARKESLIPNVHWLVPRSVSPLFAGRDDILGAIQRAILPEKRPHADQQRRFVVTGMGGQGKSEVCLAVANRLRDSFWGVFWVDVGSEATATMGFLEILQLVGYPGTSIDDARRWLSNVPAKNDWLLVLDNADDPQADYARYFPSGTRGAVLIASRDPQCGRYASAGVEVLDCIGEGDCVDLLLKSARIPEARHLECAPAARRVLGELKLHTLAVLQAGAYIAQGHCTLDQFPEVYQRQCERLLQFSPQQAGSRYCNVYATFESSIQVLEDSQTEVAKDSLALLRILSALHYEDVPLGLFEDAWTGSKMPLNRLDQDKSLDQVTRWHVSQLPDFIGADDESWDSFRLSKALNNLQSLALIQRTDERGVKTISMHPLAHRWLVVRQDQTAQGYHVMVAGCLVALSKNQQHQFRAYRGRMAAHLQSVLTGIQSQGNPSRRVVQVLVICGWLLHELRRDKELQDLLDWLGQQTGLDMKTLQGPDVGLDELLSASMLSSGNMKETILVFEGKVQAQTALDESDPERLNGQYALGSAYLHYGQRKEAITIFNRIIALGENYYKILDTKNLLGSAYLSEGQVQQAIRTFEQVLEAGVDLDQRGPLRLGTQTELARAYHADGQVSKAVQMLEDVAQAQESLDANHPVRLDAQRSLAIAYIADGQVKLALQTLEHILHVQAALDDSHGSRFRTQLWIARAYIADGKLPLGIQALEHLARVADASPDGNGPRSVHTRQALAEAYLANGQTQKAVQTFEHVVQARTALKDDDHDRLCSQDWLATAYLADGQLQQAIPILEHVMQAQKTLDESHPGRLNTQYRLASAYVDAGRLEEAEKFLSHVARLRGTAPHESHPIPVQSEASLSSVSRVSKHSLARPPPYQSFAVSPARANGVIESPRARTPSYPRFEAKFQGIKARIFGWSREPSSS